MKFEFLIWIGSLYHIFFKAVPFHAFVHYFNFTHFLYRIILFVILIVLSRLRFCCVNAHSTFIQAIESEFRYFSLQITWPIYSSKDRLCFHRNHLTREKKRLPSTKRRIDFPQNNKHLSDFFSLQVHRFGKLRYYWVADKLKVSYVWVWVFFFLLIFAKFKHSKLIF